MSETFDQADMEALLNAMEQGHVADDEGEMQIFSRFRQDFDNIEIASYDFKRPERISKDQIMALQTLHEAFARNFGAALTGFLRTIVEVSVSQVEQMTYSEFIHSLPNPTSFSLIDPQGLDGQMCLEISPLIVYPIIDRLLGGTSQELFIPQRAMTVIESRLVQQILSKAMTSLSDSWEGVEPIEFKLGEMESNPQLVQIVPPNEVVVVIRFELKMSKRAGTMSLCVPFNVIEPVVHRLDAQNWFVPGKGKGETEWHDVIADRLSEAGLEVSVVMAETTITVNDLRNLEVGDVLTTERPATEPVIMNVEGKPKYLAKIGQHKDRRAMQIIRTIEESDRV